MQIMNSAGEYLMMGGEKERGGEGGGDVVGGVGDGDGD